MESMFGSAILCFLITTIALVFNGASIPGLISFLSRPKLLSIVVLTSPDSFKNRQKQRQWMQQFETSSLPRVDIRYVVGSATCSIHPDYRISPYDCHRIDVSAVHSILQNQDRLRTLDRNSVISERVCNGLCNGLCNEGHSFKFKVLRDVKLRGFVSPLCPKSGSQSTLISLVDRSSQEIVLSSEVKLRRDDSELLCFTPSLPITLPKGFEGEIVLENWDDFDLPLYYPTNNPLAHFDNRCPTNVGIEFELIDSAELRDWLKSYPSLSADWLEAREEEHAALLREMAEYGDIGIVDHLDVYRGLPRKLLLGLQYERDFMGSEFIMKADDETQIDVPKLLDLVETRLQSNRFQILANFRSYWKVYDAGKWAEPNFLSLTYPPFPCGSGYVISRSLSQWLTANSHLLKMYQGEDVSMGIWLSATKADLVQTDLFCCQTPCSKGSITVTPD